MGSGPKALRVATWAGLLLAGLFTLAACSSSAPAASPSQTTEPRPTAISHTPTPVPPAPTAEPSAPPAQPCGASPVALEADFKIQVYTAHDVVGGDDIHLSDIFEIGKPVVLNYWAGLCPPCRAEMPDFQTVSEQYKDKVTIFGLDIGPFVGLGSNQDGQDLLKRLGITYPTGTTLDSSFLSKNPPLGMPTTFFMTPDGTVVKKWTGLLTKNKMAELIEASTGAGS